MTMMRSRNRSRSRSRQKLVFISCSWSIMMNPLGTTKPTDGISLTLAASTFPAPLRMLSLSLSPSVHANRLESTYAEKCQKFVSEHTKNSKGDSLTCVEIRCSVSLPLCPLYAFSIPSLSPLCLPFLHFSSPICSVPKIKCAQRKQTNSWLPFESAKWNLFMPSRSGEGGGGRQQGEPQWERSLVLPC